MGGGATGGGATGLPPTGGNRKKRNLSTWSSGGWLNFRAGEAALWFWVNPERHLQHSCSWWSSCSTQFRLGWGLGRADPEKGVLLEKSGG